jgi:hypothetical protein
MPQSSTLYVGLDVHKESIAVAYIPEEHGAEVTNLANNSFTPVRNEADCTAYPA